MARATRQSTASHTSARAKQEEQETADDIEEDSPCVVCSVANARVTVTCVACVKTYHLSCHSPPLRRRPAADSTWECSQCEGNEGASPQKAAVGTHRAPAKAEGDEGNDVKQVKDEDKEIAPRKRRRSAADISAAASASGTEPEPRQAKARRGSVTPVKQDVLQSQNDSDDDFMSDSDEPLVKPVVSRGKGKQPATKKGVSGKAPLRKATAKVQEPELAYKRSSRASARAKVVVARGKRSTSVVLMDEDEDVEVEDEKDNDNDSDFTGAEEEDDDDDEEEEEASESDDDFEAPVKVPIRKQKPLAGTGKAKSPSTATKPKPVSRKKRPDDSAADDQTGTTQPNGGNGSDNESGNSEHEVVEEVYSGPSYYIEYAANGRASCKSCEQKLAKDSLRIGIKVRHSIFGITTYFKHVECTQICSGTADSSEEDAPVGPLRGYSSLKPKDKLLLVAHMKKNTELELLDERRELSEDQYARKSRISEKEPSPYLTATLLPYQREALAWMTAQEQSHYKGGILADEMGMGKTIQAISLILENPRIDSNTPLPVIASFGQGSKSKSKAKKQASAKATFKATHRGGTLVVCPVVAVMQWKSEIERFVERNHLSIYIHHGAKRIDSIEKIASYDIVLTTYSIIENEVRKTLGWEKVPCKYCKKKYLPDKLILHNKYFCGPNAKKTALQDRQTKKKGKKAAGESDESSEDELMKKPVKGKGKAPPRKKPAKKKKSVESSEDDEENNEIDDAPKRKDNTKKSTLHQIHWTRIVLDEAHYIKDRRCNTARGVFELQSDYKWCLTGTPLQNRIGELLSLVRFLQIKHYAYYHCSKCECQMLDFHFPEGKCLQCEHNSMSHFSFFNKKIVVPIQSYGYVAEGKVAMLRLQNELLQHILLRRTKEGRADDISLPPKLIRIRRDRLDERENDFYQAIYTQSQAQFNTYVSSGTLLNNYAHIFDLLIRLRQAVDHPYLVIYSKSNPAIQLPVHATAMNSAANEAGATFVRPVVEEKPLVSVIDTEEDQAEHVSCAICHEDVEDPVESSCSHVFCRECVKEFIESLPVGASATCPDCDKPLTVDLSPPKATSEEEDDEFVDPHKPVIHRALVDLKHFHKHSILHRISDLDSFQTSTKIEALMQELEHMKTRDPSGKAIVFSQFVNMLDIIQHRLTIGGIKCVKLSGNMSMEMRDRTIRTFREDNTVIVFLISLKAGGVALNLTIASHIFLMDPWWNPAAENQAIDRTHRLGQFKPVQATRFIIAGTIEERILKLQQKKQLIFEGTVGGSVSAITRLTEEDLRFLFSK